MQELIQSLRHLYLENEVGLEEHEKSSQYLPLPPPPPLQEEDITTSSFELRVSKLEHRMHKLEQSFGVFSMDLQQGVDNQNQRLSGLEEQVQNLLTQQQHHHQRIQQLEETLPTDLKAECQQLKETLKMSIQKVGQATMDCMARSKLKSAEIINSIFSYCNIYSTFQSPGNTRVQLTLYILKLQLSWNFPSLAV